MNISKIDINKNKKQDFTKDKANNPKNNKSGAIKESDIRFTQGSTFKLLKELTGVNWREAYDPTPKSSKRDTLDKDWNKKANIFLNPPFSKARYFVKKLVEEMEKHSSIKKALIILPWYFVEDKEERVTSGAKWFKALRRRMGKFNFKKYHLSNQDFYNPIDKKMTKVRVYAIYLKK
jgi:16S rRNA G966 N2-methylase RsmD